MSVLKKVLDRCSLVVFQTRCITPIRDMGETTTDGARTKKEVITTFDASVLAPIAAERQRAVRQCTQFGTKVDSLSAWLVPNERVGELLQVLGESKEKIGKLAESLAGQIADRVEAFALRHPDQAKLIRAHGPSPLEVKSGIKLLYAAYKLNPDDVVDDGGLMEDMKDLHGQALHEFHMALRDAKVNPDGMYFTQTIKEVLTRISRKAASLAFLHPTLANVSKTLNATLKTLPASGAIHGAHAVALASIIAQLMDPKKILINKGFLLVQSAPSAPKKGKAEKPSPEQPSKPKAKSKLDAALAW